MNMICGPVPVRAPDYDQQPPYGFRSVIDFGETDVCVPLYDPHGRIARLKEAVRQYPQRLKARIVQGSLWGAEFSLLHGIYRPRFDLPFPV